MATVTTSAAQKRSIDANVLTRKQRSLWQDAWWRLRRNKAAMMGLGIIALAAFLAVFAPLIAPFDPTVQDTKVNNMDPFWVDSIYHNSRFPLGSDQLGRDILSRLIWSTRISLVVGLVPTLLVFTIGVTLGLLAGYLGGWIDNLLMRFTDIIYAFPDLLFVIIIMATLRNTWLGDIMGGLVLIFVALAVVNWVGLARLVRGQVLSLKEKEFVEAARATGVPTRRILIRHLFPNALAPVIVSLAFAIPGAMLAESVLSFIGIGIRPPTATWGVMINEGYTVFSQSPWPVLLPAICISLVMLAFTFLGDGLRDALDPRMKT
ncbi:MAG: oligopeptide transport system permease protein [Chloroflexota bacterium]|nr:oligopeptide transport system permease protein [Chloroflexota bacterium]